MGSLPPDGTQTDRLRWHHWPDGSVVYDRVEGSTVALSPLSGALLNLIGRQPPLDDLELAARLKTEFGLDEAPQAIREALEALKHSGLV